MGGGAEAADVAGAARIEAEANRKAAQQELWANRPDQYGPMSSTTWEQQMVDPDTGRPITKVNGQWQYADGNNSGMLAARDAAFGDSGSLAQQQQYAQDVQNGVYGAGNLGGSNYSGGSQVGKWTQNTTLNPEWQEIVDQQRGLIGQQTDYRSGQVSDWSENPLDYSSFSSSLNPTIGTGDLGQFGTTNPTTGAQDWRQFGTTGQTIGADQWQDLGYSDATIGADDWRQFGNTEQTLTGGTYDERFGGGNADPTGGFGSHGQGGSDWDQIQYAPEAIRQQAAQQTQDYMNSQLDPQWDSRENDLRVQLANQGLSWGDPAYDNAMESFSRSKNTAYEGSRNQALADSRSEAQMLWDQEMGRSEQKNYQTQADLDNVYRARQSNIQNYQTNRESEVDDYLAYQNAAFGQDLSSRQQQLDANLGYGSEAFGQDLAGRQQALDAQLGYGRESYQQDYQTRQQQLDSNRLYNQQAFDQDLQSRQANITNYLNYGREGFGQNLSQQQLALQAQTQQEQLMQNRYGLINPGETYATVDQALS